MSRSRMSLKQKDFRSHVNYYFKRQFSSFQITSNGRKRRFFVASIIALSGLIVDHGLQHTHPKHHHQLAHSIHTASKNSEGTTSPYSTFLSAAPSSEVFSLSKPTLKYRQGSVDPTVGITTKIHGIRGSPQHA